MPPEDGSDLPRGKELSERWTALPRPVQSELWRRIRRGEPGKNRTEALLIAAMAQHRLRGWTMRPEIVLPVFVAFFAVMSFVIEDFSFSSSFSAPIAYALYLLWMRSNYKRAYRRNIEALERDEWVDV